MKGLISLPSATERGEVSTSYYRIHFLTDGYYRIMDRSEVCTNEEKRKLKMPRRTGRVKTRRYIAVKILRGAKCRKEMRCTSQTGTRYGWDGTLWSGHNTQSRKWKREIDLA